MMKAVEYKGSGVTIRDGKPVEEKSSGAEREKTIGYKIMRAHDKGTDGKKMRIKFDGLISHDITYVGIIQTARASGMTSFPIPYALTNCHNSLCAVGGTINEDDHAFGLSAARKYGGIYVPANQGVIHQYARERMVGCGKMILGSDSHTRYGCYGTMGIGEGGGELAKQLLEDTYDVDAPTVTLVWLEGRPRHGIGPHDIALALVGETFPEGRVKNKILEFAGPGLEALSMDFRIGIDVMTTETSCLTSIWETDAKVAEYYRVIGNPEGYKEIRIEDGAYYDSIVRIDLAQIESMIALPFHPSKAITIHELQSDAERILRATEEECNRELTGAVKLDLQRIIDEEGKIRCEQGVIVGCAGGMYENISEASDIVKGKTIGAGYFDLSVYPASPAINLAVIRDGIAEEIIGSGGLMKSAFCGPCFGAGDTPAHNTLSIRHATRNFANRDGSKPQNGQIAAVALMDARSIAATAVNGGILTAATDIEYTVTAREYKYDGSVYDKRCYNGYGKPDETEELRLGPNITDWPEVPPLKDDMLIKLCAVIRDEVTTTDELIPSGETSSYRSNPVALSEYTLSRRVPEYVGLCKAVRDLETTSRSGVVAPELSAVLDQCGAVLDQTSIGSCVFANKPGDGSAREQAASCQKVLGGLANICYEYATKRYRSNCINWGLIPFTISRETPFDYESGDWIFVPGIRSALLNGIELIPAKVLSASTGIHDIILECKALSDDDKAILTDGCLMNFYKSSRI